MAGLYLLIEMSAIFRLNEEMYFRRRDLMLKIFKLVLSNQNRLGVSK